MEESYTEVKSGKTHKGLIGVLILLLVIIVGLVVGIVLVNLNNNGDESGGSVSVSTDEPSFGEEIYDGAVAIMDSGSDDSLDKLKEYFDGLLANANDSEKAFGIGSVFVGVLIEYDKNDDALVVLDEFYDDSLTDEQKITIFSYYSIVYSNLGNVEKSDEYNLKAQKLINETQEDW